MAIYKVTCNDMEDQETVPIPAHAIVSGRWRMGCLISAQFSVEVLEEHPSGILEVCHRRYQIMDQLRPDYFICWDIDRGEVDEFDVKCTCKG